MTDRVTVVGAGVVGLTCAVRLAEAGFEVTVLARDLPPETSSALSCGLWLPHPARRGDLASRWARVTLEELTRLADPGPTPPGSARSAPTGTTAGVALRPGHLLPGVGPAPYWADPASPAWADVEAAADDHPDEAIALTLPVIDPVRYLGGLRARLEAAGAAVIRASLSALPSRGIVVNCSGFAARGLAGDQGVTPTRRHQLMLSDPGLDEWWCDLRPATNRDHSGHPGPAATPLVALPRNGQVIVTGEEYGPWDVVPPDAAARLAARAARLAPALAGAQVLTERFLPSAGRSVVRLATERAERTKSQTSALIHCYGHGSDGLALSWGCADDVSGQVSRLSQLTQERPEYSDDATQATRHHQP